jgi:lysophospholipase L1-like esterase
MRLFSRLPILASLALLGICASAEPLTITLPVPQAPPGTPAALFPSPRLDWLDRVEGNLEKLKEGPYDMIWDGDSITDGWQGGGKAVWTEHFGKIKTADFGIGGDQVQHVLWRLQHGELDGQDPKLIMLMIGTNNLGQNPKDVAAGIKLLLNEYETRCPHAQILLLGIFPRGPKPTDPPRDWIAKVNGIISGYTSDPRVTYLDFGGDFLQPDGTLPKTMMPDALHPNAAGYEIWAHAITPVVEKYFPGQTAGNPASADAAAKYSAGFWTR